MYFIIILLGLDLYIGWTWKTQVVRNYFLKQSLTVSIVSERLPSS